MEINRSEETMDPDASVRAHAASLPGPTFPDPAFVRPPELSSSVVAIVTTAALHTPEDDSFTAGDTSYRFIDRARRDVVLGHWSPNFDRSAVAMDLNVVYPIDRLEELAERGVIGSVASRHVSFAGNQPDDVSVIRHDSGPAAAAALRADGVDVAILTPV
jgi:D-proline reductase (dithiol) PrdB